MTRDEFDSSPTLYECIMLSKIYFGEILSYIGVSESFNFLALHVRSLVSIIAIGFWVKYIFSIMLQLSLFSGIKLLLMPNDCRSMKI